MTHIVNTISAPDEQSHTRRYWSPEASNGIVVALSETRTINQLNMCSN